MAITFLVSLAVLLIDGSVTVIVANSVATLFICVIAAIFSASVSGFRPVQAAVSLNDGFRSFSGLTSRSEFHE